jgi:hypothetical protein
MYTFLHIVVNHHDLFNLIGGQDILGQRTNASSHILKIYQKRELYYIC